MMRAPLIVALSVIGFMAGCAVAAAADQPYSLAAPDDVGGQRAAPVVLDRFEPGVSMRAYWLPPWRGRHYFPHSVPFLRGRAAPGTDGLRSAVHGKRVIHAEAEITILGPDRMDVRLYRKRGAAGGRALGKQ